MSPPNTSQTDFFSAMSSMTRLPFACASPLRRRDRASAVRGNGSLPRAPEKKGPIEPSRDCIRRNSAPPRRRPFPAWQFNCETMGNFTVNKAPIRSQAAESGLRIAKFESRQHRLHASLAFAKRENGQQYCAASSSFFFPSQAPAQPNFPDPRLFFAHPFVHFSPPFAPGLLSTAHIAPQPCPSSDSPNLSSSSPFALIPPPKSAASLHKQPNVPHPPRPGHRPARHRSMRPTAR